ncbi:MAG: HAD family hydrolase [Chloroflexota bacterium]
MPGIRHIVFDLGNVLFPVDESIAAREVARLSGYDQSTAQEVMFGPHRKQPLESGIEGWQDWANSVRTELSLDIPDRHLEQIFTSILSPDDDMLALAEELATDYGVGCCSNTSEPHWRAMCAAAPFLSRMAPRVLSYEVGAMKPDSAVYSAVVDGAGVEAGSVLFIDDTETNVAAARATGLNAVRFTDMAQLKAALCRMGVKAAE